MSHQDVIELFRSIGAKVDTSTPGKVIVSDARVKKLDRRKLRPFPQAVKEHLNSARAGSLLSSLAEVMRVASQTGSLLSRKEAQHPVTRKHLQHLRRSSGPHVLAPIHLEDMEPLLDKVRALNEKITLHTFSLRVLNSSQKPIRLFWQPDSSNEEMRIVFSIIAASEAGVLDRLKAGANCQRFCIARRDVDKFCPDSLCRGRFYKRTPEGKQYNREYQRRYRKQTGKTGK